MVDKVESKLAVINGKKVDIESVLPLKIKDWRILKSEYGIDPMNLTTDLETLTVLLAYAAGKANNDITADDIGEMTLTEVANLGSSIVSGQLGKGDESSSKPSTS